MGCDLCRPSVTRKSSENSKKQINVVRFVGRAAKEVHSAFTWENSSANSDASSKVRRCTGLTLAMMLRRRMAKGYHFRLTRTAERGIVRHASRIPRHRHRRDTVRCHERRGRHCEPYKGMLSVTAGQVVVWHWTFYTTAGPPGFQQHGTAMSFDEAKAVVEAQWTRWVAAAGLRDI